MSISKTTERKNKALQDACAVDDLFTLIGTKWCGRVLWTLEEPKRFNELKRSIHEITPSALSAVLKKLQNAQLTHINEQKKYSLTKKGEQLRSCIDQMIAISHL